MRWEGCLENIYIFVFHWIPFYSEFFLLLKILYSCKRAFLMHFLVLQLRGGLQLDERWNSVVRVKRTSKHGDRMLKGKILTYNGGRPGRGLHAVRRTNACLPWKAKSGANGRNVCKRTGHLVAGIPPVPLYTFMLARTTVKSRVQFRTFVDSVGYRTLLN